MVGTTISHYRVIEKLGEGGMGVVYKAEDTMLKRHVALKFLPPDLTQVQEVNERFIYEAQTASALDHQNICTIHEIDESDDGRTFICMAYYEGETLKQKIALGPLPIEEAVDITIQIAQGLAKTHEKGIIHRDVKPANIIVQRDGTVKIIDFGLSKLTGVQNITKSGSTMGTVAYMSGEQALGEKVDHRSDIWSLGVVLYEMLTGQQPFKAKYEETVVYNIINKEPKPIKELRPESPQELQEIVKRTLNKKPDSRFSSAAEVLEKLREYQLILKPVGTRAFEIKPLLKSFKQFKVAIPAVFVITIVLFFTGQFFVNSSKIRWARYEALPEVARLLQKQNLVDAFLLAQQAQRYIPDDPQAEKLLCSASYPRVVRTTPSGADVYFKDYFAVGAEWQYIGRTPIDSTRLPVSYLRIRVTRQGFETALCAVNIWMNDTLRIKLTPEGTAPPGMVLVPGGRQQLGSDEPVELQEYWIDKYEVTNKQYKEFVDAGGYQKHEYWIYPFVKNGRTLSREQAMAEFRDATGRPGPSTWKLGTYPDGQGEYPVRGVSWYEAAACAEFAGKSLPTVYHWRKAAGLVVFTNILSLSNFDNEGPAPAGTYQGLSPYGSYDLAGNVKEWCLNETTGKRYILGGAWSEPEYMFSARDAQRPFERAETYGFRCVLYTDPLSEELTRPIAALYHDFSQEKPVKDDIFEIYENLYSYDPINLDARIAGVDESSEHWSKEIVSFNAAYGDERMIAHLYLPKNATPPYQAVIYFPGINALNISASENLADMAFVDFIPRSGRAFLYPVYKGTYERGGGKPVRGPRAFRNRTIQRGKDIQRSIDYLESREDIDAEKFAYFGMSWGGFEGPIFTAIEKRFKVSILLGGGLYTNLLLSGGLYYDFMRRDPEVNPLHFAPRSRLPVLMINGRYDFMFPVETSIVPMFRLQGAPEKDKRLALFDCGHLPPMNEVIRETLDWLDHYLGPVQSELQQVK